MDGSRHYGHGTFRDLYQAAAYAAKNMCLEQRSALAPNDDIGHAIFHGEFMQSIGNMPVPNEPLNIKPFGFKPINNRVNDIGMCTLNFFFTPFMALGILFNCRKSEL
jgi:hypothetical protein